MADRFLRPPGSSGADPAREARILRDRQAAYSRALDRQTDQPQPYLSARFLGQVFNGGSMGAAANLYYLTHPVLLTGTESEGGAATLTVDSATTVPVVVLQNAPSVGDYLTAYAVGGRWVAERGGMSGGGGTLCSPCTIPNSDLTLSWTNILTGDGSTTLTYSGGVWASGCVDDGLTFQLSCTLGSIELRAIFWTGEDCTGESNYCSNLRSSPLTLTQTGFTCSPFSVTFTVGEDGCNELYSVGNTTFTVTL